MDNARYFEVYSYGELVHLVLPPHLAGTRPQCPSFQQHGIWSMPLANFREMVGGEQCGFGIPGRIKVMPHHWNFLGNMQARFNGYTDMQPREAQLRFTRTRFKQSASKECIVDIAVHGPAQFCWVIYETVTNQESDAMLHQASYMLIQAMPTDQLADLSRRLPGLDLFFKAQAEHFTQWRHSNTGLSLWVHYNSLLNEKKVVLDAPKTTTPQPELGLDKLHRLLVELGEDSQDARDLATGIAQFGLATASELHREIVSAVNTLLEQKLKDR